jgi:transcriptional regulator with XRE-family HTH domain
MWWWAKCAKATAVGLSGAVTWHRSGRRCKSRGDAQEQQMMGEKLRKMREAKSWSQAHLAQAARVNVRTVQRIEAGDPCSFETMLSLAAALGVEVSEFDPGTRRSPSAVRPGVKLAASLICLIPGALFVFVNVMQELGLSSPYSALASIGGGLMSFRTFNLISPAIFVGGPVISVLLCGSLALRLRTRSEQAALTITGIELRRMPAAFAIAAMSAITTATLLVYSLLENLRSPHS